MPRRVTRRAGAAPRTVAGRAGSVLDGGIPVAGNVIDGGIGIGAVPGGARQVMIVFGVLLVGFGLYVAAAGDDLHQALATHGLHAVLYLLAGSLLIVAAAVAPLVLPGTRRRVVEEPAVRTRRVVR